MTHELRQRVPALQARGGFTLIELIVVLLILSLLAAVVVPVVSERANDADPTRVATDLGNLKTGYELFHLDVRPKYAGDIEDLTAAISTSDSDIRAVAYTTGATGKWDGPYMDISITDGATVGTGAGGLIQDNFVGFDPATNLIEATPGNIAAGDFIAALILGIDSDEFDLINDLVDGASESSPTSTGKLRFKAGTTDSTFYLLAPYKN